MEDQDNYYKNNNKKIDNTNILDKRITKEELEEVVKYLPKNKSLGSSGITYKLIKKIGNKGLEKFLIIMNEALVNNNIHKSWNHGIIIPIPKKPGVNGELELYRPITLLEASRKIFTRILTNRLNKYIKENQLLKGLNVGFQENKRATDLGFAILRLNELCRIKKINFEMLSLDVAKAYDSVSWSLLERSINRINIPSSIIKVIQKLTNNRTLQIITTYGLTPKFNQNTGLSQGDIISPLLWLIVYEPLLLRIKKEFKYIDKENNIKTSMYTVAIVDDLSLIATTKERLQEIVNLTASWFNKTGIRVNTNKTVYILLKNNSEINWPRKNNEITTIKNNHDNNEPLRILGNYLIPNRNTSSLINMVKETTKNIIKIYKNRYLSDKLIIYIVRVVIIPIIEYKLTGHILTISEVQSISSIYLKLLKHGLKLPSTFPLPILHHPQGCKVPMLATRLETIAINMMLRMYNGEGATTFKKLAKELSNYTSKIIKFLGEVLKHPNLITKK